MSEASDTSSLEKPEIRCGDCFGEFEALKEVGRGQFATVWTCVKKGTNVQAAVKAFTTSAGYRGVFERELVALKHVAGHPNIAQLLGHGEHTDLQCSYLITPKMSCDLFTVLRVKGAMPVASSLRVIAQVTAALRHCHHRGFAHADLKPENVLCNHGGKIILTDFGGAVKLQNYHPEQPERGEGASASAREPDPLSLSASANSNPPPDDDAESHTSYNSGELHVTDDYRAPEVILEQKYTAASDMWSLGCLLFEISTGLTLFPVEDQEESEADSEDDTGAPAPAPPPELASLMISRDSVPEAPAPPPEHRELAPPEAEAEAPPRPGVERLINALPLSGSESDDDSDYSLSDALEELTEHQAMLSQLAAIVRVIGPVTKTQARKHAEFFTLDGRVHGFEHDQPDKLRDLLADRMPTRDAAIIEALVKRVVKHNAAQRATAEQLLRMRSLSEFYTEPIPTSVGQ